jgi:uncharacterized protein (DUF4415 family)
MKIDWDPVKAAANLQAHGVSFGEGKGFGMKKIVAEPYRDIDFTQAKQVAVIPLDAGKTKISIRLDNKVIEDFRAQVERAGTGSYQTLINDALVAFIQQRSMIDAVRQVIREELATSQKQPRRSHRLESA